MGHEVVYVSSFPAFGSPQNNTRASRLPDPLRLDAPTTSVIGRLSRFTFATRRGVDRAA